MHLRAKRGNQTVFLKCDLRDTVGQLCQRLAEILTRDPLDIAIFIDPASAEERHVGADHPGLQSDVTLKSVGLVRDGIVYFILRDADTDAWESLKLQKLSMPSSRK